MKPSWKDRLEGNLMQVEIFIGIFLTICRSIVSKCGFLRISRVPHFLAGLSILFCIEKLYGVVDPYIYLQSHYDYEKIWNISNWPTETLGGADAFLDGSGFGLLWADGTVGLYHDSDIDSIPYIYYAETYPDSEINTNTYNLKEQAYRLYPTAGKTGLMFLPPKYPGELAVSDYTGINFYDLETGEWMARIGVISSEIYDIAYDPEHDHILVSTKYDGIGILNEHGTLTQIANPYAGSTSQYLKAIKYLDMENDPLTYDMLEYGSYFKKMSLDGMSVLTDRVKTTDLGYFGYTQGIAYTNNYIITAKAGGCNVYPKQIMQDHMLYIVASTEAGTPPGLGTQASPYLISKIGHLLWMSNNVADSSGKYYRMTADIDASETVDWNNGAGFCPIGTDASEFLGTFDGDGHTITDLVINRSTANYIGLFGSIGSGGVVKNVGLVGGSVTGSFNVGSLAGENSGTVSNVYATGSATGGNSVGGLIGVNFHGTVSDAYSTGVVTGTSAVGGLVGMNDSGTVSNSYWDTQTSRQSSSAGGTGKTTAEMKQQATFVDWDFAAVWVINEGVTYPLLRSFLIAGDANADGVVDVGDLGILAANYGGSGKGWFQGDFNNDGWVDVGDLGILAAHYGTGSSSGLSYEDASAQAFGTTNSADSAEKSSTNVLSPSACSSLGLPIMVGMIFAGLLLVKVEE